MKLVRYEWHGRHRLGALFDGGVVDLGGHLRLQPTVSKDEIQACEDVLSFIRLGARAHDLLLLTAQEGAARIPVAEVRLLPPIQPRLILCSGENYWDHRDEKPVVEGKEPEFFLKNPLGVIGPHDAIELDNAVTSKLDYECELLVVIGKRGRHIPVEAALEHVFGFTIMNDVTARDRQVKLRSDGTAAYSLGPGKSFDTSAPIGPAIVTRQSLSDPQNLLLRTYVNGELRQNNNTSNMIWSIAELVAFFSTYITLEPGVVISTGTPGGTGWGSDRELGARGGNEGRPGSASGYLHPGDRVECEIENIGTLVNRVVAAGAAY